MSESAPEQAKPGEADGVVGHCACEVDEVEEHFARGHGCGGEEGGERVEGVEQEEALAHEGEGGDGECEAAAVAGEAGGEGEGEGEGEEVDVCLEGVLHAFLGAVSPGGTRETGGPTRNLSLPLLLSTTRASTCSARTGLPPAAARARGIPFCGARSRRFRYSPASPSDGAPSAGTGGERGSSTHASRCVDQGFGGADELESGGDGRCDMKCIG